MCVYVCVYACDGGDGEVTEGFWPAWPAWAFGRLVFGPFEMQFQEMEEGTEGGGGCERCGRCGRCGRHGRHGSVSQLVDVPAYRRVGSRLRRYKIHFYPGTSVHPSVLN